MKGKIEFDVEHLDEIYEVGFVYEISRYKEEWGWETYVDIYDETVNGKSLESINEPFLESAVVQEIATHGYDYAIQDAAEREQGAKDRAVDMKMLEKKENQTER